jgi:hypothetical protein
MSSCRGALSSKECGQMRALQPVGRTKERVGMGRNVGSMFRTSLLARSRTNCHPAVLVALVRVKNARVSIASLPGNRMWPSACTSSHLPVPFLPGGAENGANKARQSR